jgi:hypothetical protein
MRKAIRSSLSLATGALFLGGVLATNASTIFDNSVNDLLKTFEPGTLQVGDEIVLGGDPNARYLTSFSFEYWGTGGGFGGAFSGNVQARVQFYLNDGAAFNGYATPGTSFYDSGLFYIPSTPRNSLLFVPGADNIPAGGLFMPVVSNFTWTVTFSGMGAGDHVGLDLYSPPAVGSDYPDYWQFNGGGWTLMTNSVSPTMDFASKFEATVPEPSSVALGILSGAGLLLALRRNRKH